MSPLIHIKIDKRRYRALRAHARVGVLSSDTAVTRTFQRALETMGGEANLAAALKVTVSQIDAWISGESTPPVGAFNAALDIVATGARSVAHD